MNFKLQTKKEKLLRMRSLPVTSGGLSLSRKGIIINAFGPNLDGEGTLLRLWEVAGNDGKCGITLPAGLNYTMAVQCDLRGQMIGKPLTIKNSTIVIDLNHYAPLSMLLK